MLSTSLAESLGNRVVIGFEKHDLAIDAMLSNGCLNFRKAIEGDTQITGIDNGGNPFRCRCGGSELRRKGFEQPQRQVIDAVVSEIFEGIERDTLSRPG